VVSVARLVEIATRFCEGLPRDQALAELAAVSTDPDLLAEAAAVHALADNWYAIHAVDLLMAAGAPRHLVEKHVDHSIDRD
jgi:hypothetical protein